MDYFIGSLHHVNAIPIDYSREMYVDAMKSAGPDEESMYARYYDQQHEMLTALEPRVVGHFDLVRLMSENPGRDVRLWKGVWEKIVRNLEVVKGYGGLLECNSSALRKGLDEPYPCRPIAEVSSPPLLTLFLFLSPEHRKTSWSVLAVTDFLRLTLI